MKISIFHLTIYKNLLKYSSFNYIEKNELLKVYRKTIYRASASFFFEITKELECLNMIAPHGMGFLIRRNDIAIRQIKEKKIDNYFI